MAKRAGNAGQEREADTELDTDHEDERDTDTQVGAGEGQGTSQVGNSSLLTVETVGGTEADGTEADDNEDDDDIPEPLTEEEVLEALEFVTEILAEAENDPGYLLDKRERKRLVPFLTEQFNKRPALIKAVRSLDFFDGWGLVAYSIIRRAVRYYRKHLEGKWDIKIPFLKKRTATEAETETDQEGGPRIEYGRDL